jgi:hypothetical protein
VRITTQSSSGGAAGKNSEIVVPSPGRLNEHPAAMPGHDAFYQTQAQAAAVNIVRNRIFAAKKWVDGVSAADKFYYCSY